ncbi:MAG: ABC transporter substrate-binding protein [Christensenellales bacterium]|jgi:raffinose/stachyose/melibiose transport system substrate-binding protein
MRKNFALALALMMLLTLTTVAIAENSFQGKTLSILVSSGWMDNRYNETIARFEDTYGVTVDIQTVPADQYSDLLQSKLITGTAADIFWIQSNPFAIDSVIVNPEEYCIDFTGEAWQDVMPVARQASCISNGKLYGLQIWHNSPEFVLVYNKTMFDEMGLEIPATYDELLAVCEKLDAAGVTPWFMPGADGWQHQLAFFMIGGIYEANQPGLYDGLNNNTATFAGNETMLKVLNQFKEMSDKGYFGKDWIGTNSTNMANEYGDRAIGMAMANSSFISQIKEDTATTDEFGMFLIPFADNAYYPTNPAGPTMFGYSGAQDAELVKEFFRFVCTPESLQEILDNSPSYTNLDVNADIQQHWLPEEEVFVSAIPPENMNYSVLQTGTKYTNDYWMQFGSDMVAMCTGQMTAKQVLENMDANRAVSAELAKDSNWAK